MNILLFDVGVPGGTTTLIAGIGFFFILAAAAYVMFRLLRKTVKMAFRMAMVVTVLFTLVIGGVAAFWFGTSGKPRPNRQERTRQR